MHLVVLSLCLLITDSTTTVALNVAENEDRETESVDDDMFNEAVDGLIKFFSETKDKTFENIDEDPELLEMLAGYIAFRMKKGIQKRHRTMGNTPRTQHL